MILGKAYLKSVMDMDVTEVITPYERPVLSLHGTNDWIIDRVYIERAAKAYKNIPLLLGTRYLTGGIFY